MTMSFVKEIIDDKSYVVELITSINPENEMFYAYLLMQSNLLEKFKKALREENVNLEHYGVVLASGPGHEPPEAVHDYINKRLYLANVSSSGEQVTNH